jgi:PHP family Zn ribbon phosphoesterase
MLRMFKADLHIHTCLSPCADLEMSPKNIASEAKRKGIDILGICDHNSAENTGALVEAGGSLGLRVLPGLEATTKEEVHILGLFDDIASALRLQSVVYDHLPGENDEKAFGMQIVVSADGDVLGFNPRLLIGASTLALSELAGLIHSFGGLAIASHIDREAFGLIGQLGFIPENVPLDALEISPRLTYESARSAYGPAWPITSSSDAHFLSEIGQALTSFWLEEGTVEEIRMAFAEKEGRKIVH